jgi:hypothetical protein
MWLQYIENYSICLKVREGIRLVAKQSVPRYASNKWKKSIAYNFVGHYVFYAS